MPKVLCSPPPYAPGKRRAPAWTFLCAAALALGGCVNPNARLALPRAGGAAPATLPRETSAAERIFWERLDQARVIYIGETHNSDADHEYQFEVLKGLKARGVNYAIGWEMFDVTQQPLLNDWQARQITSDGLLERSNWRRSWGAESVMYETMLRWSLAEGVPSLALNAPRALSHKVAFGGSLSAEDKSLMPRDFRPLPGGLEHFTDQLARTPHGAGGGSAENFYKAQVLWEQTMASRILAFIEGHPEARIVVLTGRGHLEGGFGIPAFVRQKSAVRQLVLFPGGAAPGATAGSLAQAGGRAGALVAFSSEIHGDAAAR